jgi:hypothetical protein
MGSTQLEAPLDGQEVARNHAQVIAFNEAGAARKIASDQAARSLSAFCFSLNLGTRQCRVWSGG